MQTQKNKFVLEVEDQGIGVAKEARSQLFREFYRGQNAINSRVVGSGIGLLMTQKYVNLHAGTIEWKSEVNEGSLFRVVLPGDLRASGDNIPAAQRYGITHWCPVDSPESSSWRGGEPVGLWSIDSCRKHTYAGFADGLSGK